ncbi:MAG: GTP-binding protein [Candidatus Korarchaeota archaeon]
MVKLRNPDEIRNLLLRTPVERMRVFSIVAHIHHGKTATTDYLLSRAGVIAATDAGRKLATQWDEIEREKRVTIFTTNMNLTYTYEGQEYFISINDTPGHISWTGEVSRALRCSDGVILLVDGLEGVMTQTETNVRLAVGEERCKPVLFINKVDRLIDELKLSPKSVMDRLSKVITDVNKLIDKYAPPEHKEDWKVSVKDGTVAIGSAKDGWAFTFPTLQKKGLKATVIFEKYANGEKAWLRENLPLHEPILEMVITHLPNPLQGQREKLKAIWPEEEINMDDPYVKGIYNMDPNGPLMGIIAKVVIDPKTRRAFLVGRVYSGTLRQGQKIKLLGSSKVETVSRLGVMEITDLLDVPEVPAGRMFAVYGFLTAAGETFADSDDANAKPFRGLVYAVEPVISRAIAPKDPAEIDKLLDLVHIWTKADPTLIFKYNKESKECILSGVDNFQIEVLGIRLNEIVPIELKTPIIVYREKVTKRGEEIHTKSSTSLNRIRMYCEPLPPQIAQAIKEGKINMQMEPRKMAEILRSLGMDAKLARNVWMISGTNMLVNATVGVQRLDTVRDYIISTFNDFVDGGAPLAGEPVMDTLFVLTDASIHEDPAHRGFNEIFVPTNAALNITFLTGDPQLLEPILKVDIKAPAKYAGNITALLNKNRGKILDLQVEGDEAYIIGTLPTANSFTFADDLRSITEGRGIMGYEFLEFAPVPKNIAPEVIKEIRRRKEMPVEIPTVDNWKRFIYVQTG